MAAYNYDATTPSSTWIINHNLNKDTLIVDVLVPGGSNTYIPPATGVITAIEHSSNTTMTVRFATPQVGKARIVG